jgi:hypothetical protein
MSCYGTQLATDAHSWPRQITAHHSWPYLNTAGHSCARAKQVTFGHSWHLREGQVMAESHPRVQILSSAAAGPQSDAKRVYGRNRTSTTWLASIAGTSIPCRLNTRRCVAVAHTGAAKGIEGGVRLMSKACTEVSSSAGLSEGGVREWPKLRAYVLQADTSHTHRHTQIRAHTTTSSC